MKDRFLTGFGLGFSLGGLVVLIATAQAQEVKDTRKYLYPEFRSVTAEAKGKGDCVKSLTTGKVYQPMNDGRWGRCVSKYTWNVSDEVQVEFYAPEHKAGHFAVVQCEECR